MDGPAIVLVLEVGTVPCVEVVVSMIVPVEVAMVAVDVVVMLFA